MSKQISRPNLQYSNVWSFEFETRFFPCYLVLEFGFLLLCAGILTGIAARQDGDFVAPHPAFVITAIGGAERSVSGCITAYAGRIIAAGVKPIGRTAGIDALFDMFIEFGYVLGRWIWDVVFFRPAAFFFCWLRVLKRREILVEKFFKSAPPVSRIDLKEPAGGGESKYKNNQLQRREGGFVFVKLVGHHLAEFFEFMVDCKYWHWLKQRLHRIWRGIHHNSS